MPAKDPDVRPESEPRLDHATANALRDELERAKERLCMLEAQLAHAQQTAPDAQAFLPQPSAPVVPRSPIRLPMFDEAPVGAIAERVQAAANARNASMPPAASTSASAPSASMPFRPMPFVSMPSSADADTDVFEPTARLDAGQIRQAHRTLAHPYAARRTSAALLCLGTAALWCGMWQMRLRDQQAAAHSIAHSAPQTASDAPVLADVRAPGATPVVLPEPGMAAADHPPIAAPVPVDDTNQREQAPIVMPRFTPAPRSARPPSVLFGTLRLARTADRARPGIGVKADPKPLQKQSSFAHRQVASVETPTGQRHAPERRPRLALVTERRQHSKAASRPAAWALQSQTRTPDEQPSAFARPSASQSRPDFGLGSSRPESARDLEGADEQAQAQAVRSPRLSSYGHGDRQNDGRGQNDIETNVDHAIQTLDKMRQLLDNMGSRRKAPARP